MITPALVSEIFLGTNSLRNIPEATLLAHVSEDEALLHLLESVTEHIEVVVDDEQKAVV